MTDTATGYVPGAPDITQAETADCPSRHALSGSTGSWYCTRNQGHPMPHAAGAVEHIAAIWDDNGLYAQVDLS
jgi:hypothetical protein